MWAIRERGLDVKMFKYSQHVSLPLFPSYFTYGTIILNLCVFPWEKFNPGTDGNATVALTYLWWQDGLVAGWAFWCQDPKENKIKTNVNARELWFTNRMILIVQPRRVNIWFDGPTVQDVLSRAQFLDKQSAKQIHYFHTHGSHMAAGGDKRAPVGAERRDCG